MSHPPDSPLFYTLSNTNCYDGTTNVLGIFDSMRALGYRLQRIHTTCGDEYHIDCFHISTAVKENDELIEVLSNRVKYQRENAIKEQLYKRYDEESTEDAIELADKLRKEEDLAEQLREERLNVA